MVGPMSYGLYDTISSPFNITQYFKDKGLKVAVVRHPMVCVSVADLGHKAFGRIAHFSR